MDTLNIIQKIFTDLKSRGSILVSDELPSSSSHSDDINKQDLFLPIQARWPGNAVEAKLFEDGRLIVNLHDKANSKFNSLEEATETLALHPQNQSTIWQCWSFYDESRQAWTPLEHLRALSQAAQQNKQAVKTSQSHPLRIDEVSIANYAGKLGLTFCPGKHTQGIYSGTWQRNLEEDLNTIQQWGAHSLISLMELFEFPLLGLHQFPQSLDKSRLQWIHLPITDMAIPGSGFEEQWQEKSKQVHQLLKDGEKIVIHCRGGLGRTGLLAARILVEAGIAPRDAVTSVRQARPHSIETYAQEHYILTQAWNS